MELIQTVTHLLSGTYLAYADPKSIARGKMAAFFGGLVDRKMRSIFFKLLGHTIRNPGSILKPAYIQSLMIIQPVNFETDGRQKTHRIHPVPEIYEDLAVRYMPRIWVHPESWQPIDFDDYLAKSRLVRTSDRKLLIAAPSVREMIALDYEEQCAAHLETDEVPPRNPAPIYIQVFRDQNPADQTDQWIYAAAKIFHRNKMLDTGCWIAAVFYRLQPR